MTANIDTTIQRAFIAIGWVVFAAVVALNLLLGSCLLGSCIIHYEAGKGVVLAVMSFHKIGDEMT